MNEKNIVYSNKHLQCNFSACCFLVVKRARGRNSFTFMYGYKRSKTKKNYLFTDSKYKRHSGLRII